MAEDCKLRTLTCDPRNRTVLVSDVEGGAGRAVAEALLQAGAARVYGGYAGSRPETDGIEAVPLDPADEASVARQVDALGGEIDIVVCTAGPSVAGSVLDDTDAAVAERQMADSYFGRLRLARAFGPVLRDRAHGAEDAARAWVNLLSAHALSGGTGYGTSAAGQAAALSLSQALRAELAGSGVRVIDVFAGPLDDDANVSLPPPRVRPAQLGRAVVEALAEGLERVAVGPVAEDMLRRFEASPLAFEREEIRQ